MELAHGSLDEEMAARAERKDDIRTIETMECCMLVSGTIESKPQTADSAVYHIPSLQTLHSSSKSLSTMPSNVHRSPLQIDRKDPLICCSFVNTALLDDLNSTLHTTLFVPPLAPGTRAEGSVSKEELSDCISTKRSKHFFIGRLT